MLTQEGDLLRTARPVLFEHEDEPHFGYFGGGSAFLFNWRGFGYALTAKHVVKDYPLHKLRITYSDAVDAFLPLDTRWEAPGTDEDWRDLALFRVDPLADSAAWLPHSFPLTTPLLEQSRHALVPDGRLLVAGYPGGHIDHDSGVVSFRRTIMEAAYVAPCSDAPFKHRFRTGDASAIESFHGFSGSPVFTVHSEVALGFAGIMIQGYAGTFTGYFVDSTSLAATLATLPSVAV